MVTRTAGRLLDPSPATTLGGTSMPVAVLPAWRILVRNRMLRPYRNRGEPCCEPEQACASVHEEVRRAGLPQEGNSSVATAAVKAVWRDCIRPDGMLIVARAPGGIS